MKMPLFKNLFKEARKKAMYGQGGLCHIEKGGKNPTGLMVVPAYISRMEKGFSLPSDTLLLEICEFLDLDFELMHAVVSYAKSTVREVKALHLKAYLRREAELNKIKATQAFVGPHAPATRPLPNEKPSNQPHA
jgi:DNA-binding XRE family transcriptional regulator